MGKLVVISGPSGVGKSTLVRKLCEHPGVVKSITATTRAKRPGDVEGKDYLFLSRERFEEGLRQGEFVEHAAIYGQLYGTPRKPLEENLGTHRVVLLEIDVQGARSIRQSGLDALYIYILPPDLDALRGRLEGRKSESREDADTRLRAAEQEMAQKDLYDLRVVNDDIDRAAREIMNEFKNRRLL